ncbi:MerR family transcriptional regulator [Pseudomonas sp. OIL-1]|uniref:MerR family transcriptional regulator n=1 Tax=Pseudomonas sp. OIL-1 TaxID=2706126 RepID=UPI002114E4AE|nr:MerR family transcriptional regulator [Pseudomonas sp. OIL-1]
MITPHSANKGSQLADDLLPIREVARQTGVNPVTLRAWERRYGLIQPQRTPKGHRLYSAEHIARIRQVLGWLQRGVAVGQVKRLLQDSPTLREPISSLWDEQLNEWLACIEQLAERQLDDVFNRALALYPSETLCEHLMSPLLAQLQSRWAAHPSMRVEQVFFLSWLRSKLNARIYHGNRLLSGAPLLMLNLSDRAMEPNLWICAWLASNAGYPVRVLEWPVPAEDLALAAERIRPCALLLFSDQCIDPAHLKRLLGASQLPLLLCGHAVSIHRDALQNLSTLHLADTPLAALHCLQRLSLPDGQ